MIRLVCTLTLLATALPALADVAIINARIHTMTSEGALDNATVIVRDGRIAAVGADIVAPDGIEVIDAAGRHVTPGIFDPLSSLGAVEVSLEESTNDTAHAGRYGAGFDISTAINPASSVVGVNLIEGVTRALVVPSAPWEGGHSVLAGQAAAVVFGSDPADVLVRPAAGVVAYLGARGSAMAGGSRAAAMQQLREALEDADDYNQHRDDYDEGDRRDYAITRLDLKALLPVVSGRTPLIVYAERASDLRAVVELKRDFDLRVIVAGAAEAWMVADLLAANDVGVILDPFENLPGSFDSLNASMENATRLAAAGVAIAFTQGDSHNPRNLTQVAGNAVAYGLEWDAALRAITVSAPRMLGLGDECCAIVSGADADLVLWDGDPLDVTSFADAVFVRGEAVDMRSRQTLLRDRYRQLLPPVRP
ncbi:MAG: hypothetical protein AAFU65_13025, partial [Pseudomonadota bacterium]